MLSWRSHWFQDALSVCVAVLTIQGCSMPGPKSTPQQIAAIDRQSLPATSDSLGLSYLRAGDATTPRVIFIHGTRSSANDWADFLIDPAPGFESVAVDRLGFGQSGGRDGGVSSFQAQAQAIAPLLIERKDSSGVGRWPVLVGHSLGAPIAARLAAMYPGRVRALVLVAGPFDPALQEPGLITSIAATSLVRFFLPQILDNSLGELDAAQRQTTLLAPELRTITCTVVIIHGTADEFVSYQNALYLQALLVNAKSVHTVTLNEQRHFVLWDNPAEIWNVLKEIGNEESVSESSKF